MFKYILIGFIGFLLFIVSCEEVTVEDPVDLDEQKQEDIALIREYLSERNISEYDTTESGAWYYVADQGSGDPIVKNDILKINYIGKTLSERIVYTNIPEVADTSVAVSTFSILEPRVFTYSETGWTLNSISFREGTLFFRGRGINEAIGKGFRDMNIGGTLVVLLPSNQALGPESTTFIDPFSVLVFEIYPIEKI